MLSRCSDLRADAARWGTGTQKVRFEDLELVRSFADPEPQPRPGFATDFLGIHTDCRFLKFIAGLNGQVEGLPFPGNFNAKTYEWIGTLRSVAEARRSFTMVELGAGWAPWLVAAATAAKSTGITHLDLTGVEADRSHAEFMSAHFRNNGLDPSQHRLLHGAIGTARGTALFPIAPDPSDSWGAVPRFFETAEQADNWLGQNGQHNRYNRVPVITVSDLLADKSRVDLIHIDLQGSEAKVIDAARKTLNQKVSRLVIGTHGRVIEAQLHDILSRMGWTLELDDACSFRTTDGRIELDQDGTQVWRNPRRISK